MIHPPRAPGKVSVSYRVDMRAVLKLLDRAAATADTSDGYGGTAPRGNGSAPRVTRVDSLRVT